MRRLRALPRTRTALLAVVFAGASTVLATSSAASVQNVVRSPSCLTVDGITEQTVKYSSIGSSNPPMQQVGDTAIYYDVIYDSTGAVIGDAVGIVTIVQRRASDGHLLTDYKEAVHLPQGTLSDVAVRQDRNGMIAGDWLHFTAVGTSGAFAGKHGYRRWRLLPPLSNPPVPSEKAQVEIGLCGRG